VDFATWLAEGCVGLDTPNVIAELGGRLNRAGIPVWRISSSFSSMHPEVKFHNVRWTEGAAPVVALRAHGVHETKFYIESPIAHLDRTGETELRRRLDAPVEFPICRELAKEGATDYLMQVLPFGSARLAYIAYSTRAPGGFDDDALARLRAIRGAVSMRLEICSLDYITRVLLDVYLGASAAERVLGGAVTRGTGAPIDCAIFFCDMRGFTSLSDRRPAAEVVATLDHYFEAVAAPIHAHGGEILKFIGDAVLAIFPVRGDRADVCARALAAAVDASAAVRALPDGVAIGVALHVGEVHFGNIGARERLDFTVIGAAVNEVCRVESLCKSIGRPVLVTSAFARALGAQTNLLSLGEHALKGVSAPQELFALASAD
jgi:adenylate cyclase